jgi:WD40 repeat protein
MEIKWDYGTYAMLHPTAVVAAALCPAKQNLPADAHPDGVYCVIGYIATADRAGVVRIWGNDQKYLTVMQTQQPVQTLVWSPDGNFLAIGTIDGVVRIWQAGLSSLPALWTQAC